MGAPDASAAPRHTPLHSRPVPTRRLETLADRLLSRDKRRGSRRHAVSRAADAVLVLLALAAVATLVAQHGFFLSPEEEEVAKRSGSLVLYSFVGIGALKLVVADDWRRHLGRRRVDFVLFALVLVHALLPEGSFARWDAVPFLAPDDLATAYLVATQALLVLALLPGSIRASKRLMARNVQPSTLILLSFVVLIAAGTGLLLLPRASRPGSLTAVDALFTSASASSVTGLTVVDTPKTFTPLGQWVLLFLIQTGGLGIMTLTTFFAVALKGGDRLKQAATMQSLLGEGSLGHIRQTAARIAIATLALEALGALVLYRTLPESAVPDGRRLFSAVFHSVSAFCNAGFALTSDNLSGEGLRDNIPVLSTLMVLITIGGLGFPVLAALWDRIRRPGESLRSRRLDLHTRLVLLVSAILVAGGTGLLWALELGGAAGVGPLEALFQSVSARTAGFNSVDLSRVSPPALFVIAVLMWIGGSPASTAGGVKTTTVAVALLTLRATAAGRAKVELFRRQIGSLVVGKAFSAVILSLAAWGASTFLLLVLEGKPFLDVLFESVSALSTVGLSTGITPTLSTPGRLLVALLMLVGRVGLLGTVLALTPQVHEVRRELGTEDVLVT